MCSLASTFHTRLQFSCFFMSFYFCCEIKERMPTWSADRPTTVFSIQLQQTFLDLTPVVVISIKQHTLLPRQPLGFLRRYIPSFLIDVYDVTSAKSLPESRTPLFVTLRPTNLPTVTWNRCVIHSDEKNSWALTTAFPLTVAWRALPYLHFQLYLMTAKIILTLDFRYHKNIISKLKIMR